MGVTAFAVEPITNDKRHLFKEYKLWGRQSENKDCPIVKIVKEQMKEEKRKKFKQKGEKYDFID